MILLFFVTGLLSSQIFTTVGLSNKGLSNDYTEDEGNFFTNIIGKVRNWFKNIGERIFGTKSILPPYDTEILKLDETELQNLRMTYPKEFFLDLSNLKFNSKDWGFHIGNWLIIRKYMIDTDIGEWESSSFIKLTDDVYQTEIPNDSSQVESEPEVMKSNDEENKGNEKEE